MKMKVILFALCLFVSLEYVRMDEDYDIVDYTRVLRDDCPNGAPFCEDSDEIANEGGLNKKKVKKCTGSNCK
uniref:Uncharacterized protein n=1 Tax=Trichobilharzia regenti TaxID=157069 RepID=A0AA85JVA2_TRIRE|nr:unnamed protein product [Trichobilharzia regenti]